jgi:hypothetical protein
MFLWWIVQQLLNYPQNMYCVQGLPAADAGERIALPGDRRRGGPARGVPDPLPHRSGGTCSFGG